MTESQAFPIKDQTYDGIGLTKREYFAAMALQGILTNAISLVIEVDGLDLGATTAAVYMADQLIEALKAKA